MDYININKVGDNYWYQPNIMTFSRRKWQGRVYKNLKKLLVTEHFFEENLVIRFNKDQKLNLFHMLQQYKEVKFSFKNSQIKALENNQIQEIKIAKIKPIVVIDKRSLTLLKKGFLPFYSKQYINKEFKNIAKIIWRKAGWQQYKDKIN